MAMSPDSTAAALEGNNDGAVMACRVLRKVDLRLMPLLFITYMFNFMDKTILSSASVFGLISDTVCVYTTLRCSSF
jgi:hypothetical protein